MQSGVVSSGHTPRHAQPAATAGRRTARVPAEVDHASWQFYTHLAEALFYLGRRKAALSALSHAAKLAGSPKQRGLELAKTLNVLGAVHCRLQNFEVGERLSCEAASLVEKACGPKHPDLGTALYNLAAAHKLGKKYDTAVEECERALAIFADAGEPCGADPAYVLDLLGELYLALDKRSDALAALRRALDLKERVLGCNDWSTAVTLGKLGEFYLDGGCYSDAEPLLVRALAIKRRHLGKSDPALTGDVKRLARLYSAQCRVAEVEMLFKSTPAMLKRALGSRRPEMVRALRDLAKTRSVETKRLLELSIAILEKAVGPRDPDTETGLEFYSEMLRVLNLEARKTARG